MATIDLNQIIANDNSVYKVKIVVPENASKTYDSEGNVTNEGKTFSYEILNGFMTNSLSFSGANSFEGAHQGLGLYKDNEESWKKIGLLSNQVGKGQSIANKTIGGITETIARWQSSQKPSFSFNIMFIRLSPGDDIIKPVKLLMKGTLPTDASGKGLAMGTMEAPYGYYTGFSGSAAEDTYDPAANEEKIQKEYESVAPGSTWTVQVGKWFRASKLILNSCNFNFSQQCTPDGLPLYVECQLVFESWRLLRAGELDSYFLK